MKQTVPISLDICQTVCIWKLTTPPAHCDLCKNICICILSIYSIYQYIQYIYIYMSSWICVWYEPRASGGSKFKNNPGLLCYTPGFLLWGVLYKFDGKAISHNFLLSIRQLVRRFLLYTWGCILFSGVLIALLHPSYILYIYINTIIYI